MRLPICRRRRVAACTWGPSDRGLDRAAALGRGDRRSVEDVVLGDLDLVEPEGAHRLDQDHDAGDDRRRPVRVQADDLGPLGERRRREPREQPLDRRAARGRGRGPARGRRGRAPSSTAASEVGVPATAIPFVARASGRSATAASIRERTSAASASSSRGRRGVGGDVALGVADDAGLERGVEVDPVAVADDQLGRAAADVDRRGPARSTAVPRSPRGR